MLSKCSYASAEVPHLLRNVQIFTLLFFFWARNLSDTESPVCLWQLQGVLCTYVDDYEQIGNNQIFKVKQN